MVFRSLSYRSISRRSGWGKAWVSVATVLVGSILPVTTVASAAGPIVVEVRVGAGADDAEEAPSGSVNLTSSDLELTFANGDQVVGMRFANLAVPQGASIVSAYVQFQADEESFGETTLTIEGEAVDDAATFSSVDGDISVRPRTTSSVVWSPPPWTTVGEAGSAQRTEDVASVIQEIVDRPGWAEGAALALIITGTGDRVAESFNGVAAAAALLHVEYLSAVTVLASDARATEGSVPSDDGVFTVTRGGPTDDALTVSYTVGGDATAGSDYVALSGSVTIPAGAASAIVTVTPLDDTETEGSEDVTLTVIDGTDYVARSPATATIAILDAAAVVVSVLAGDGIAVEGSVPTDEGVFTLTRTGSTANATAVSYLVGGDASDGSDYVALPNSVTLPAGAASVDVPVTPIDDTATEGSESVTLTVIDGADYLAGSPATATITIVDDDQTVELRVQPAPTMRRKTRAETSTSTVGTSILVSMHPRAAASWSGFASKASKCPRGPRSAKPTSSSTPTTLGRRHLSSRSPAKPSMTPRHLWRQLRTSRPGWGPLHRHLGCRWNGPSKVKRARIREHRT